MFHLLHDKINLFAERVAEEFKTFRSSLTEQETRLSSLEGKELTLSEVVPGLYIFKNTTQRVVLPSGDAELYSKNYETKIHFKYQIAGEHRAVRNIILPGPSSLIQMPISPLQGTKGPTPGLFECKVNGAPADSAAFFNETGALNVQAFPFGEWHEAEITHPEVEGVYSVRFQWSSMF